MSTKTRAERADIEPKEPRCRICRDPDVRRLVNDLLDWRGVPVVLGGGKTHRITYADILRDLEPLNEGCGKRNRITYDSLWIHAKRHYDLEGEGDPFGGPVAMRLGVGGSWSTVGRTRLG